MTDVVILWHTHGDDDDEKERNLKMIGVYSSEQEANKARGRKLQYPGFRETPQGFEIQKVELNVDHWSEGFITVDPTGEVRGHRH